MHSIVSSLTRSGFRLAPLSLVLVVAACGGGGGGGGGGGNNDDGGGSVDASDLAGTWGGTLDDGAGSAQTLEVEFAASGDIASVTIDGSDAGLTGSFEETADEAGNILLYNLDGDTLALYVDASGEHAGMLVENGTVGVIEKGTTALPTFASDAAVGTWEGQAVNVVSGFDTDGIDPVSGSFALAGGVPVSNDFTVGSGADACSDIDVNLGVIDTSYGIYDGGTATGGTGADCPDAGIPANAYLSADAEFMVIYANCEAGTSPGDCAFIALSRTGGDSGSGDDGSGDGGTAGFAGTWSVSGEQTSDCGDDGLGSSTLEITQDGNSIQVSGLAPGVTFAGTVVAHTAGADEEFSYTEGDGTTTVTGWEAVLAESGDSFNGNSSFVYQEGDFSCNGTTTFSGTRN